MPLLSSFDINLKEKKMKENIAKYGEEKVLLVKRSRLFLSLRVGLPLLIISIFFAGIIGIMLWQKIDQKIIWYSTLIAIGIIFFLFFQVYWTKFCDYILDFVIITPKHVIGYNQTWLRNRSHQTIETDKLKSITVRRHWWLSSIFNNGDMSFLSEWDQKQGEIRIQYIKKPGEVKNNIMKIIKQNFGNTPLNKKVKIEE